MTEKKPLSPVCYPIAITALFFLLCAVVWPLGILGKTTYRSASLERGTFPIYVLSDDSIFTGTFIPAHKTLTQLSFRFQTNGDAPEGTLTLTLADDQNQVLASCVITSADAMNYRYACFPLNLRLDTEKTYTYSLKAENYQDAELLLFVGSVSTKPEELQQCFYNNAPLEGISPVMAFTYKDRADRSSFLPFLVLFSLAGLILCTIFKTKYTKYPTVFFVLLSSAAFLWMNDQSRTPLTLYPKDMERTMGYEDNTGAGVNPDHGNKGVFLTSPGYLLDRGAYTLGIAYLTDSPGNSLTISDNGVSKDICPLTPGTTYARYSFTLDKTSPDFQFSVNYAGTGSLAVYSIDLIPSARFYNDTLFLILLLFAGALAVWRIPIKDKPVFLFLSATTFLAFLPYLDSGLNWAVDLCYHLIRIEGIKDGLLSGQFPVVIYPEAMHGNGYLNCMYPSLFLYLPALLRMFRVSMADSFKFLVFVFHAATAFITYYCVRTMKGTRAGAMLAAFLYTCCPYRFTNLYARGAVGEFLAMTFFPLIFAGLYHILIGDQKKWGLLVLGMTGLLQSHILSVTLAGIFCGLFCLLYIKNLCREKRILSLGKAGLASLLLNAGFLVPFLDFYKNENLWMNALSLGTYQEYALNISGLLGIQLSGDYHLLTLGIPLVFCALIALFVLLTQKREHMAAETAFAGFLFLLGAALMFMATYLFPGWDMMKLGFLGMILEKIQFAWRLLGPVSLLFAVTGSFFLFHSQLLAPYRRALFTGLILLCILSASRFKDEDFAFYNDTNKPYTTGHESKLIGIPKGANTIVYPYEWRIKSTLDSGIGTDILPSDDTLVSIIESGREGTATRLSCISYAPDQYVEIPVIFYRGYRAYDESGALLPLTYGRNNRIRIPLNPDRTLHHIRVFYHIPILYTLCAWISIFSALILAGWSLWNTIKKKKETVTHAG